MKQFGFEYKITNKVNDENYIIKKPNFTEVRHWIINHLDSSIEWFVTQISGNLTNN